MGYKFFIKMHEDRFYFGLYPGNNNRQPIAISRDYPTFDEAKAGIETLKAVISKKQVIFRTREEKLGFYFELAENKQGLKFRRTKAIQNKYQVSKCINRIYEHIDAPLKLLSAEKQKELKDV